VTNRELASSEAREIELRANEKEANPKVRLTRARNVRASLDAKELQT
jgi:hypothetical protein